MFMKWLEPSIEKRVSEITDQGKCRSQYDDFMEACKGIQRDTFLEIESMFNLTLEKVVRHSYVIGLRDGACMAAELKDPTNRPSG